MNSSPWPFHEYCFCFGVKRGIWLPIFRLPFTNVLKVGSAFSSAWLIWLLHSPLSDIIDFALGLRTGVITAAQRMLVTHSNFKWCGQQQSQNFNICWNQISTNRGMLKRDPVNKDGHQSVRYRYRYRSEFLFNLHETGPRLYSRHVSSHYQSLHESGGTVCTEEKSVRYNQMSNLNTILITLLSSPLEPLQKQACRMLQHCHIYC